MSHRFLVGDYLVFFVVAEVIGLDIYKIYIVCYYITNKKT